MKTCTRCGIEKDLSGFSRAQKGSNRLKSECRQCASARSRAWNDAHPERVSAAQKRYRERAARRRADAQAQYRKRTYVPTSTFGALARRPHVLYRVYDADGELLYVGITVDPKTRLRHHRKKPWWPEVARVTMEEYPDRASVLAAESIAICAEYPTYNIRKRLPPVN